MANLETLKGPKLKLSVAGLSDVGLIRSENQDRLLISKDRRVLVVADGMGGHNGGSVASQLFIDFFEEAAVKKKPILSNRRSVKNWSDRVIKSVNGEIYKRGRNELELWGMGTTAVVLVIGDDFVHCAHVGDSRIYRFREGKLQQLTRDHSAVQDLIDAGEILEMERKGHPRSHIVTRFVGDWTVEVEHHAYKWQEGDIYILCSDGLSDVLDFDEIETIVKSEGPIKRQCSDLVEKTLMCGAPDNVTVVVASV